MITTMQLTENLKSYINSQLSNMSKNTPMIGLMKPLITRALDNNLRKLSGTLNMIADQNGNIDIENILTEMIQNVVSSNPFTIKTPFIGDIEIGGGKISLNLPFTDKRLVLNEVDLQVLKETLITKGQ